MKKRALIILHPGFEEIEAITAIDLLSRANVEIFQASVSDEELVTGRSGITLKTTDPLSEVIGHFDVTILPGGPGIMKLRQNPIICQRLKQAHKSGGMIACICAAPLLLKDAGLLTGLEYTAHPSTSEELDQALLESIVQDGQVITSRGAGTATEFALAIVDQLCGSHAAKEIAQSICWSH